MSPALKGLVVYQAFPAEVEQSKGRCRQESVNAARPQGIYVDPARKGDQNERALRFPETAFPRDYTPDWLGTRVSDSSSPFMLALNGEGTVLRCEDSRCFWWE